MDVEENNCEIVGPAQVCANIFIVILVVMDLGKKWQDLVFSDI